MGEQRRAENIRYKARDGMTREMKLCCCAYKQKHNSTTAQGPREHKGTTEQTTDKPMAQ